VQADQPGHRISPTLYGIFFEGINCSDDGGLYAEMVRNRSFEDSDKPDHWFTLGGPGEVALSLDSTQPVSPKNPHSLKVSVSRPVQGRAGVANEGYWGMWVKVLPTATALVLASASPADQNSIDQPTKVAPVTRTLACTGSTLQHTFPANSVTVLRLKVE
jgi:hypothetical protein